MSINTVASNLPVNNYYTSTTMSLDGQSKGGAVINSGGVDNKEYVDASLVTAIEQANHIQTGTTECQFSIHKSTNQIMIKIVDTTTQQVVKEIPSEKILDMIAKMCDLAGLFIDEKR